MCVSYNLLTKRQKQKMRPDHRRFRSINNTLVKVKGICTMHLTVLDTELKKEVRNIEDMPVDCVIRLDVIEELEEKGLKCLMLTTRCGEFYGKYGMPVASSICNALNNEITVRMVNPSNDAKHIYLGTRLGTATTVKQLIKADKKGEHKVYWTRFR